ncbi:MAG TPA: winged helix-turn-helix domain-containing protein, partial [Pyrinomonadaceae bacterium]|nr:winged helix-turn-helix domain-containing protein [Pyrinomonadaceae bacterium]
FETLLILVENSGRIVQKEQFMERLWPHTFVDEANLTSNIQQLRKSLGDNARQPRYIETVTKRGYRFIANVQRMEAVNSGVNDSPTLLDTSITAIPAAVADRKRPKRKVVIALATAAVAVVFGGLGFWRLLNTSSKNLGDLVANLPLKIERLTASGQSSSAAISPDGRYVAYTQMVKGRYSIWIRQITTNTNTEIVSPSDNIVGMTFSHSGEYLYFVKGDPSALYRVSLSGDVPIKILERLEGKFSLSPDDSRIAFVRVSTNSNGQQEHALIIANSDGTNESKLLSRQYPDKLDAPAWSPDGESIVCAYGNSAAGSQGVSLVEVRAVDGNMRKLSGEKFYNIAKIAWLPQKTGLIMSAAKKSEGYRQLWRVSYPNMQFTEMTAGLSSFADLSLTSNGDKVVASQSTRAFDLWVGETREPENLKKTTAVLDKFCWTPDGRLVYSVNTIGNVDLWVMRPDGQEQRQLTLNSATNDAPTVTPDGRYIVFISNRAGAFQVWRMKTDGSDPVPLTNGGGKNFPAISPDGKWVLYNTTDDWQLWRVPIDRGESTRLSDSYALFPSISPDGKMIACLGRNDSKPVLKILPFDGGPPLKTFDLAAPTFSGDRIQWTRDGKAVIYGTEVGGVTSLFRQPLSGGEPIVVMKFEDELADFSYSHDGQSLAVARGGWQQDIVLIRDLSLN